MRPHGLIVTDEAPRPAEQGQFGWRARLRQHAAVHAIAQRAGWSSRGRERSHAHPYQGNGYHYEADEVRARVDRGEGESDVMTLDDSVAVAGTIDTIRAAICSQSAGDAAA